MHILDTKRDSVTKEPSMTESKVGVSKRRLYRVYIDESGDHTYRSIERPDKRYLGLTGCIIEAEYYRTTFHPALEALKQKHFPHDPDEPVVLHREDILNRKGPFWRLRDENARMAFDRDLLRFFEDQEYILITVVIDKKGHVERYGEAAFHPYHYCLTTILERYCGFLDLLNASGDVMGESRGTKEDKELMTAYNRVYDGGTQFRPTRFFQKVLPSHKLKIKPKIANIAGLQIADLLAHPSKQEILFHERRIEKLGTFAGQICHAIGNKYNREVYKNRIEGYGKIFLK